MKQIQIKKTMTLLNDISICFIILSTTLTLLRAGYIIDKTVGETSSLFKFNWSQESLII